MLILCMDENRKKPRGCARSTCDVKSEERTQASAVGGGCSHHRVIPVPFKYFVWFFFFLICMNFSLSQPRIKSNTFEMGSYPTKRTPVHCLHFTLRNLLLCQDLSHPHHEGVNEGRSPRVLLTSFNRTQFSPLPLPLSRLSTQLKNSPPSMSMGQDYSCIILYL